MGFRRQARDQHGVVGKARTSGFHGARTSRGRLRLMPDDDSQNVTADDEWAEGKGVRILVA